MKILSNRKVSEQKELTALSGFDDPVFVEYYEETDNNRQVDLAFYRSLAEGVAAPVLDAGCGSGRILIPLLESGIEIHGFDSSELMLQKLRIRLLEKGLNSQLQQATLSDFEIPDDGYELVICSFNTFLHLLSHREQLESLRRIRSVLKPGGRFAFDLTNPFNFDIFSRKATIRTFEATQYDARTETDTKIWRWFERDLVSQTGVYHREYENNSPLGPSSHRTSIPFRWTYPSEMELLLKAAGYSAMQCFGDFEREPLTEDSEMQVWIAEC